MPSGRPDDSSRDRRRDGAADRLPPRMRLNTALAHRRHRCGTHLPYHPCMSGFLRRCILLPLLLGALLLQGCALSRAQIRRADAVVAATVDRSSTCARPDHCAVASPLRDAAIQALAQSTVQQPVHVVTLLDDTEPALAARINLIRAAQRSIDVQTFIWDQDD